jgi:tetratricopeptide (TPR) repeat protein
MIRTALFATAFALLAGSLSAQQVPNASIGTTPADISAEGPRASEMTPRQIAEMHADLMMARKEYAEAAQAYQTILIDSPHDTELLNYVGMAYQQLGNDEQAEHFYKLATRADKTAADAYNNLGTVEYGDLRYGKAIKYYRKSIATGHALPTVYTNLGYAYCSVREYPKALVVFHQALALDPEVFDHKGSSGSVLQQRSSTDPSVLNFMLAKSFGKLGDAERSARYLKLARDEGYKEFLSAEKDPDFARVIKDPRVQEVLRIQPAYAVEVPKPVAN